MKVRQKFFEIDDTGKIVDLNAEIKEGEAGSKKYHDEKRAEFREYLKYYDAWRKYDLFLAAFCFSGLVIQMIAYEYENDTIKIQKIGRDEEGNHIYLYRDTEKFKNPMDDPRMEELNFYRVMSLGSTIMAQICLFLKFKYENYWEANLFHNDKKVTLYYKYKEVTSDPLDRY